MPFLLSPFAQEGARVVSGLKHCFLGIFVQIFTFPVPRCPGIFLISFINGGFLKKKIVLFVSASAICAPVLSFPV